MIPDYTIFGMSVGLIFVVISLIDLVFKVGIYDSTVGYLLKSVTGKKVSSGVLIITMGIIGLLMIGGPFALGKMVTASIGGGDSETTPLDASSCTIDKVRYSIISGADAETSANITLTEDELNSDNYFVDTYNESSWINSGEDINGTLTLWIEDQVVTGSECNAVIYAVGPSFKNQIETGANADDVYDLLDGSRSPTDLLTVKGTNRVDMLSWRQNVYLNDGAVATTTSDQEMTVVKFEAGEVKNTLGFTVDIDSTAFEKIKKNNQVAIQFRQQLGDKPSDSDPVVYTVTLRKGVSG